MIHLRNIVKDTLNKGTMKILGILLNVDQSQNNATGSIYLYYNSIPIHNLRRILHSWLWLDVLKNKQWNISITYNTILLHIWLWLDELKKLPIKYMYYLYYKSIPIHNLKRILVDSDFGLMHWKMTIEEHVHFV